MVCPGGTGWEAACYRGGLFLGPMYCPGRFVGPGRLGCCRCGCRLGGSPGPDTSVSCGACGAPCSLGGEDSFVGLRPGEWEHGNRLAGLDSSRGTAMTPSAQASPRIMPGPVCEVGKASPSMNVQGISRVRPGHGSTSAAEVTCATALRGLPPSASSSGAPIVMRAIIAARGLPGSPTTKRPSGSRARTAGWPGRMAMPSSSSCPPRAAMTARK
ncbi:hypothetical protein AHiyo4_01950 [Arthrobacter sp. Hiyo4]|nr:hypothetical protein AHiyo4_01950 [Arthrobacter sp. Hiyo4]